MLYQEIELIIKEKLSISRYQHTKGVVKSAIKLASRYGVDLNKAKLAALLHDIGKPLAPEKLLNLAKKYKLEIDDIAKTETDLLHGPVGSNIAHEEFAVKDQEILQAISYHTTGRANMSKLEKIIYLADYIEEGRDFPGLERLRKVTRESLDQAVLLGLNNSIQHIIQSGKLIHPNTIEARNDLLYKLYYNEKNIEDEEEFNVKESNRNFQSNSCLD